MSKPETARPALRALHVAAEAYPLIKTGGLADVIGALPAAQRALGVDVRLLLPGYPAVLAGIRSAGALEPVGAEFGPAFGAARVVLLRGTLPGNHLPTYVIDAPWLYARDGDPYVDAQGQGWADNHLRFGLLSWVGAQLAEGALDPHWRAELVHAHDWHAGLVPLYLSLRPQRTAGTVFTIHNLAFQGRFALDTAAALGLPSHLLSPAGVEFHGDLSFMKAALQSADAITTVSPSYAREILTPQFGHGLDGVLREQAARVSGVLNGADIRVWDPTSDALLAKPYSAEHIEAKALNKRALQDELGLEPIGARPLFAVVSRLTEQKGLDLLLQIVPALLALPAQLVVLGNGEPALQRGFTDAAVRHRGALATVIGFDEALSHRIFGGADAVIVPSRFEPCGLTQLYGLRYGTVPIARRVGGLADTIADADEHTVGTGFLFDSAEPAALLQALTRATLLFKQRVEWRRLVTRAMRADVSWAPSARRYLDLYAQLLSRQGA